MKKIKQMPLIGLFIFALLALAGVAMAGPLAAPTVPYSQQVSGYHYYAFPTNVPPEVTVQQLDMAHTKSAGPVQDDGISAKGLACWWQLVNAPASGVANTATVTISTSPDGVSGYAPVETINISANHGNAMTAVDFTGDVARYWQASVTAIQNAATYINLWCTHNAYR